MQDRFFIQQQLSIAEFYKASLYLGLRNKRLKKIYFMVLGLMCLLGLSNLFLLPKTDEKWYVTVLQVITPLLFPVIFLFAGTFILCVLMMVIKPNNFKNIIYEFTHWGMFKKGKGIEYSRSWRDFIKLKETKSFIFLYTTENDAHVIQKRMFRDTDEMENFKKFADQNIWSNS